MKRSLFLFAALALFLLPTAALADTFTFYAPPTAPNQGAGGANQFDLDHHRAYTWRISGMNVPAGHTITSATLTFKNMSNWDTNPNRLFVHLLNSAQNWAQTSGQISGMSQSTVGYHGTTASSAGTHGTTNGVTWFRDVVDSAPVTALHDNFAGTRYTNNPLVVGPNTSANNTLLHTYVNLSTTPQDYTITFTPAQIALLAAYIAAGNDIAFGLDPDCHFWNNGIVFNFVTTPPVVIPEPTTMFLLGTGIAGLYLRKRRRQK